MKQFYNTSVFFSNVCNAAEKAITVCMWIIHVFSNKTHDSWHLLQHSDLSKSTTSPYYSKPCSICRIVLRESSFCHLPACTQKQWLLKSLPKHTVTCANVITFNPQRNAFGFILCILPGKRPVEYRILQRHSKKAILTAAKPLHPQRKSLQAHCHGNVRSLSPPKSLTLLKQMQEGITIIIPQQGWEMAPAKLMGNFGVKKNSNRSFLIKNPVYY